jgi:hypothetical protein
MEVPVAEHQTTASSNPVPMGMVSRVLGLCYDAGPLPVMLWGPPGIGKSSLVRQFAVDRGLPFVDIRLPLYDPVDLKGIPGLHNVLVEINGVQTQMTVTKFFSPDFLPRGRCCILFDELAGALPATQIAAQRIVLDRSLDSGWEAHPETIIVAASNRRADRSGSHALLQSLDNRFIHCEVVADPDFWSQWLQSQYSATPVARRAASVIAAFVQFRPELAYKFDPDASARDVHGFPSFRTWENVCRLLIAAAGSKDGFEAPGLRNCIQGAIGVGAGMEFTSFLKVQAELPNVDDMLKRPDWQLPPRSKIDVRWALVGALAARCEASVHNRLWEIIAALEADGSADLAVVMVKFCLQQDRQFGGSPRFVQWANAHRWIVGK